MRSYRRLITVLLTAFLIPGVTTTLLAGCASKPQPVTESAFLMGTYIKLTTYGDEKSREALRAGIDRIAQIEDTLSVNKQDSEVIRLNKHAGKAPYKVSEDTLLVVQKALYYSRLSGGRFDPTIGPVVKLWNIGFENARVPDLEEVRNRLKLVDYRQVEIDPENNTVYLKKEGMMLDLGGIAKGFAADEVGKVLKSKGINSATINLGGNILAIGEKPDGMPWKIGIQNPFAPRGDIMGTVLVKDESLVTSGDYERFIIKDGKRYHHILDPATGMPANTGIKSVTIVTKHSTDADALSTSVFIMGPDEGMRFIESHEGIEGVIITRDYNVLVSSGLKERFTILNQQFKKQ